MSGTDAPDLGPGAGWEQEAAGRRLASLALLAGGVAHEFRNILNGIYGYGQMGLQSVSDQAFVEKALRRILDACRRGEEVVTRLGHFAGHSRPEWEIGDISAVIRDMVLLWTAERSAEGIAVETDFQPVWPVRFDSAMLGIILLDLLENARQAVLGLEPPRRWVAVKVGMENDRVTVRVRDGGEGLSAEEARRAVEPFYTLRGPLAGGSVEEAKGLGLAAVMGLAGTLGARLTLAGKPGEGLEVCLCFPASQAPRAEPARILVVDDEAVLRHMFEGFLQKAGYLVTSVPDGESALARLDAEWFDLILLDQLMPGLSGLQVLARLRERAEAGRRAPPVVMITSRHSPDLAREAIQAGAVVCVGKPINRRQMLYLVATHAGGGRPETFRPDAGFRPEEKRLLLLHSDPLIRDILALALERTGYRVQVCGLAREALAACDTEYYDAILTDFSPPDRCGPELVRELRLRNPYTPIMVVARHRRRELTEKAKAAGATCTLENPLDLQPLLDEIGAVVATFSVDQ